MSALGVTGVLDRRRDRCPAWRPLPVGRPCCHRKTRPHPARHCTALCARQPRPRPTPTRRLTLNFNILERTYISITWAKNGSSPKRTGTKRRQRHPVALDGHCGAVEWYRCQRTTPVRVRLRTGNCTGGSHGRKRRSWRVAVVVGWVGKRSKTDRLTRCGPTWGRPRAVGR
jgi:hypothetical protein